MRRRARDPSRFFARGAVDLLADDPASRQIQLEVTAPACVVQAAMPQLLAAGLVDDFRVAQPLSVWVPTIAEAGFRPSDDRDLPARLNAEARAAASSVLQFFKRSSGALMFPGDLVPLLPMGTYVSFKLRCGADALAAAIQSMVPAAGVAELRFAAAHVLAAVLSRWGDASPALPS